MKIDRLKWSFAALLLTGVFFGAACNTNESLYGNDINNDGVRDDVEKLIQERYPDSEKTRAGLNQAARIMQKKLRAAEDTDALGPILSESFRAIECMRVVRGQDGYDDMDWLHANFHNTKERVFRYIKSQNNAPGVGYEITLTPSPDACDFDLSTLPN